MADLLLLQINPEKNASIPVVLELTATYMLEFLIKID